jgi:iron complex outermembrane receptor protein
MINLDRIEIIKGPSASIAGSSESGGYVNFITKKPQMKESIVASATVQRQSGNPSATISANLWLAKAF